MALRGARRRAGAALSGPCPTAAPGGLPRFGDRRGTRIGLLGGSFNPAHEGHRAVARRALRRLGLDQVWLLVSPGNPLKPARDMGALGARLASARRLADGRRVVATDLERRLGTRYTADTLRRLRRRFPRARFVWLMGADSFAQLPRWRRWEAIMRTTRIAVLPRPGSTRAALAGQAARRFGRARLPPGRARALPSVSPPAWIFLPEAEHSQSATAIRARRATEGASP